MPKIVNIICRGCRNEVPYEQTGLEEIENRLASLAHFQSYGRGWTRNSEDWVCPTCLAKGLAIAGDPFVQNVVGSLGPFWAYWDVEDICSCGQHWVFSAQEQKFWYETARLPLQAVPVGCETCRTERRKKKQAQSQTMDMLPKVASLSAEELESLLTATSKWARRLELWSSSAGRKIGLRVNKRHDSLLE